MEKKPHIVPEGKEVYEYCLVNKKIRKAEWADYVRPLTWWERLLIFLRILKRPKPVKQLVEYEECIYIPAQNEKIAKKQFNRILRMSI